MTEQIGSVCRRRFASQKGQVLIELAFCGVIYALLIAGTLDLSRVMFRYHQMTQVAREGVRIASMTADIDDPSSSAKALVTGRMNQILTKMNLISSPGLTAVITSVPAGVGGTKLVKVTLSQSVGNIIGAASLIPGLSSKTLTVTIAMPQFV